MSNIIDHIKFNLNDRVLVKLNNLGYQRLADLHNQYVGRIPTYDYRTSEYYAEKADKDGYTNFQFWSFMQDFGEVIGLAKPTYFDLNIIFNTTELQIEYKELKNGKSKFQNKLDEMAKNSAHE